MNPNKVPLGQSRFGEGPYTIDDITTNAAVLLRSPNRTRKIAVMNFDALDAPSAYDIIDKLIERYMDQFGLDEDEGIDTSTIEAIVVGGEFREHIPKEDEGIYVYISHDMTKHKVKEALDVRGIKVAYIPTNLSATKRFTITGTSEEGLGGCFEEPEERLEGHNQFAALKSLVDYEQTIGKYKDAD